MRHNLLSLSKISLFTTELLMNERMRGVAKMISHILLSGSGVNQVALTGSLARDEVFVRDIDLVVLHTLGDKCDLTCHLNHRIPDSYSVTSAEPRDFLKDVFSKNLDIAVKAVAGITSVDLIFVQEKALNDCTYLRSLSTKERYTDFYKRIFCELPLLPYDSYTCEFKKESLRHNCRETCKPAREWIKVRKEVKDCNNPFIS
jgi:hypothetical protein